MESKIQIKNKISLSIIILSWDRKEDLLKTLEDLKSQSFKDFEIIVVDQGSTDGVLQEIENKFSYVKIIRLHKNFGVPGGRNVGAINALGDILVFLDNDASFCDDALQKIENHFNQDARLGILGFKILINGTNELDLSSWAYQKDKINDADKPFETYTFCGCAHAIKREVFEQIGYYWDELFFAWEEVEFSIRAIAAQWKITYDPSIEVYHRISKKQRTVNSKHECLRLRNSLWVLWRYMPIDHAISHSFVRIFAYLVKSVRQKCFLKMFCTVFLSFQKIGLFFQYKDRIPRDILKKYIKLSSKGSIIKQLKWLFFK